MQRSWWNRQISRTAQAHWFWMIVILLITALLGSQGLNVNVIWSDELTSIGHAGGLTGPFSITQIIQSISEHSPKHAPLYFVILSGWGNIVGWHHVILRSLSLFFGLITIAWIYRIGKDFVNIRAGVWAAAFLGLNVFWIEYYHEIRMYSLQLAIIMMMLWHYLYLSDLQRHSRWYHWGGLIFSAVASLYTQPMSIFVHVAIGIYHLLFVAKKRRWFTITFAFMLAGILYLPWFPVTTYLGLNTELVTATTAMTLEQAVTVFIRLFSNGNVLICLFPLVVSIGQLRHQAFRQQTKAIWLLAIFVVLLLLAVNEYIGLIPMNRARYFFVSWGLWSVIMGIGFAFIRYQWLAILLFMVFVASGFALRDANDYERFIGNTWLTNFYPPLQDYVYELTDKIRLHDYVIGFSGIDYVNHTRKHGKSVADYYMETLLHRSGTFIPTMWDYDFEEDVPKRLGNNPYILFTYNPQIIPDFFDSVLEIIQYDYIACEVIIDQADFYAQRYVLNSIGCNREYAPIDYDNGVTIVDKYAEYDPTTNIVRILTGWEVADEQLLYEYNVSIQIVTDDWQNAGQTDRHLHDDLLKWYITELPTEGLPAGDYRVMVIVYHRDTGEKVTGTDLITGETSTILPITVFTIEE
jgi:hypothetical protein